MHTYIRKLSPLITNMHTHAHTHTHSLSLSHGHTHTHTHTHTHSHIHTHTFKHTHTHTNAHTNKHTHAHTSTSLYMTLSCSSTLFSKLSRSEGAPWHAWPNSTPSSMRLCACLPATTLWWPLSCPRSPSVSHYTIFVAYGCSDDYGYMPTTYTDVHALFSQRRSKRGCERIISHAMCVRGYHTKWRCAQTCIHMHAAHIHAGTHSHESLHQCI